MIKFTIPVQPISKKNSQQIFVNRKTGKAFIMPSKAYKQYESEALKHIPKNIYINVPCNIECVFYMGTRRKCDLTNLLEAIDDIMVKSGLLSDDNYTVIQSHDGSRVRYDKKNPRTEVTIQEDLEGGEIMSESKLPKRVANQLLEEYGSFDNAINELEKMRQKSQERELQMQQKKQNGQNEVNE